MPLRAADDQEGADPVLAVRLQEIRDAHLDTVRTVAGRWEQGLRGLLGITGLTGLVSAPLAADRLAAQTQLMVGILLAVVLLVAGAGLTLAMSAAYGSLRTVPPPTSLAMRETQRAVLAERSRMQMVWGRRLAVAALILLGIAIALAWSNPGQCT